MLWWFLILGFSVVVVVVAAIAIFVRVRQQMKRAGRPGGEIEQSGQPSSES